MTISIFKKMTLALALATAGLGANATTYSLGTLGSTSITCGQIDFTYSFDDIFKFNVGDSLGTNGGPAGVILAGDLTGNYEFGVEGQGYSSSGSFSSSSVDGSFGFATTFSNLTAGTNYALRLTGTSTILVDPGSYSVTLAPVPEPETYAMLLAGLGLIGAVLRRRQAKTTTNLGA